VSKRKKSNHKHKRFILKFELLTLCHRLHHIYWFLL